MHPPSVPLYASCYWHPEAALLGMQCICCLPCTPRHPQLQLELGQVVEGAVAVTVGQGCLWRRCLPPVALVVLLL